MFRFNLLFDGLSLVVILIIVLSGIWAWWYFESVFAFAFEIMFGSFLFRGYGR